MNSKYLIIMLLVLAIMVVSLVFCLNKPLQTPIVTNTATTTVATSTNMSIKDYEYLRTITPYILKDLPGWNPTMEVEGMKRVEDNNPELEVRNYPSHVFAQSWKNPRNETISTFIVKYLEPEFSVEACGKYGVTGSHAYIGTYRCVTAPLESFNEFIIYSEAGEILHKFKLKEGYSLINNVYFQGEGDFINIHPFVQGDNYLLNAGITKRKGNEADGEYITYQINLITGEITEIKPR